MPDRIDLHLKQHMKNIYLIIMNKIQQHSYRISYLVVIGLVIQSFMHFSSISQSIKKRIKRVARRHSNLCKRQAWGRYLSPLRYENLKSYLYIHVCFKIQYSRSQNVERSGLNLSRQKFYSNKMMINYLEMMNSCSVILCKSLLYNLILLKF